MFLKKGLMQQPSRHTYLQATQAETQTKAYKKVCLPKHTDREESTGGNITFANMPGFCKLQMLFFKGALTRIFICPH